jgi:hypothetical protein
MTKAKSALLTLLGVPGWLVGGLGLSMPFLLVWPFWHVSLLHGIELSLLTSPLVIGAALIPIAAALGPLAMTLRPSQKYPGRTVLAWAWRWMWLWGNEEDGIDGAANAFWPQADGFRRWKQIVIWSAWRNSVGNARWLPFFGLTVRNPTVYILPGGSLLEGPYIARQGVCFELRFCWNTKQPDWRKRRYFWVGWRLANSKSGDAGVGFAFQPRMNLT